MTGSTRRSERHAEYASRNGIAAFSASRWRLACGRADLRAAARAAAALSAHPGVYRQTESRNSAFKQPGDKSKTCFASADFDTFRDETMAQYHKAPQFVKDCRLSDTKSLSNGIAFAMACKGVKTVITFHFTKNLVSSTIEARDQAIAQSIPRRSSRCPGASASVRGRCRARLLVARQVPDASRDPDCALPSHPEHPEPRLADRRVQRRRVGQRQHAARLAGRDDAVVPQPRGRVVRIALDLELRRAAAA